MTSGEKIELNEIDQIEDQTSYPPWSQLPSPATEKIYSFLDRSDQISMSLACRNWREELNSPSLWREMTLCFPDFEHITGMCPEIMLARKFGAWFHHVKIVRQSTPPHFPFPVEPSTVMRQLELFFAAVTCQSQLLSISLFDVGPYLRYKSEEVKAKVYRMILNFMKSQKKLQSFEIYIGFKNDEDILKALYVNNYKTLRELRIPSYNINPVDELADITVDEDLNFLVFMNLEVLEIDFTPMFGKMMSSFYEYRSRADMRSRKGRLKKMILHARDNSPVAIEPRVWMYFRKIFPDLSIDLDLDCWSNSIIVSAFIIPEMPLRTLDTSHYGMDGEIGSLLRHITSCGFNHCLEELKILWFDHSPINLLSDFISFTNAFSKLMTLELDITNPVVGLDTVLSSWLENRPVSLRIVKITIWSIYHSIAPEKIIYTSLNDFYAPLLQPLELILSVKS